jgi:hypothetical protein
MPVTHKPDERIAVTAEMIEAGLDAYYDFNEIELTEEGRKVVTAVARRLVECIARQSPA